METATRTVQYYPVQKAFLRSNAIYKAFVGGIGSGKSWVGAYDLLMRAKPNRLYMVCAPTYTMLADASFRSFVEMAFKLEFCSPGMIRYGSRPSAKMVTGAEVLFRSTDDPDHLRGPNLSGVWMDESGEMKKDAFDILIGRLRQGGEQGWLSSTFTPKGKTHWTYKTFGQGKVKTQFGSRTDDGKVELFHAKTRDNPFNHDDFESNMRKSYSAKQAAQELGGEFLDSGGNHFFPYSWPRYVDIGDAFRIRRDGQGRVYRKAECMIIICIDWAMGKKKKDKPDSEPDGDFTAFVVCALAEDGTLFIMDVMNKRLKLEENAPALEEMCRIHRPFIVAGDDDMLSETMLLDCRRYRIPEIRCLPIASRNKLTRAQAAIIHGENGRIYLPEDALWLEEFCDQLGSFTGEEDDHDDMVDALGIGGRLADELKYHEECSFPEVFVPGQDLWSFR